MRFILTCSGCIVALVVLSIIGLSTGPGDLNGNDGETFFYLRMWRMSAAALAGAALAMGGVLMQGLFRNPLASPDVLGTTAFAIVGGQGILVMHVFFSAALPFFIPAELLLPLGCLIGAGCALLVLLWLAERAAGLTTVLIVGFLLAALGSSLGTFVASLFRDQWELVRALQGFSLGGVDGTGPVHLALAAPLVIIGGIAAWCWSRPLDVLLAGESEAAALGVDVAQVRRWSFIWTATLAAAAVSLGGSAAFVGLIVPHVMRACVGVSHRQLLPVSALGGAAFLVACDIVARVIPPTGELPLGVVTGIIGAPLFIFVLLRTRRMLQ